VFDRFELLAFGMLNRRDEEIGPFFTTHTNGIILTTLAAPNLAQGVTFYQPTSLVGWCKNRFTDDLVSLEGIVIVNELHAADNVVGSPLKKCSTRALDENMIIGYGLILKEVGEIDIVRVTVDANPDSLVLD